MKRRIVQNRWGNWNGYAGTRKVIEFGTDEWRAKEWVSAPKGFKWTRIEEGPLTERNLGDLSTVCPAYIAFNKTSHVTFAIVIGGERMRKAAVTVKARTARRADQWALALIRCRWLNRKGLPIQDTRKIWIESRTILTPGGR